jgi:F0F1-type ATP synthase assembly protein I
MLYSIIKALLSGIIVSTVSETAKRSPSFGALIASLPIVSVLGMIWLWQDTKDSEKLAAHSEATFWMVLPSLPMFLVLPALLRTGMHFYLALSLSCLLTIVLYFMMVWVMKRFGFNF